MKDRPPDASRLRLAVLVNQFATPGLGSLMAGRYVTGALQLLLALAGVVLIVAWFIAVLTTAYSIMESDAQPDPPHWLGWTGLAVFGLSWLWAGVTSISLLLSVKRVRQDRWQDLMAHPEQAGTPPPIEPK